MRLISSLYGITLLALFLVSGCAPASVSGNNSSSRAWWQGAGPSGEETESLSASSLEVFKKNPEYFSQAGEQLANSGPVKEVYFAFDSYVLTPAARATLRANAEWLKKHASIAVQIEGHADERGTNEYNLALGSKRARVVMDYLSVLGVLTDRLSAISYGEELPVCVEKTEECWQRNRRAHFVMPSIDSASLH